MFSVCNWHFLFFVLGLFYLIRLQSDSKYFSSLLMLHLYGASADFN